MKSELLAGFCGILFAFASQAPAVVIGFEGAATAATGGSINVGPTDPYTESGFMFTPSTYAASISDPALGANALPGDSTAWFGFQGGQVGGPFINYITLTGPTSEFDLNSFLAGRSYLASQPTIDLTATRYEFEGGILTATTTTFAGLTAATMETVNWTDLTSVVFYASSDAGLDNISVDPVPATASPEPGAWLLVCLGLTLLASLGRRLAGVKLL